MMHRIWNLDRAVDVGDVHSGFWRARLRNLHLMRLQPAGTVMRMSRNAVVSNCIQMMK
jgi:hypothetical protein